MIGLFIPFGDIVIMAISSDVLSFTPVCYFCENSE